jgi:hypothetical protein
MESVCAAFPILPGKTDAARAFMRDVEGPRKAEFAASEQRIGIPKESWYMQSLPTGDILIVYLESEDPGRSLGMFAESQDGFDRWFKDQILDITGADLNQPMAGPPSERLSSYVA